MPDLDRTIQVGTAIGIATLGIDSFHKFLPSIADVRAAKPGDRDMRAQVRAGELMVGVTLSTVGLLAASVAGNALPLVIAGFSFLSIAAVYESLLRTDNAFGG